MAYDPFSRGRSPVGVRSGLLIDESRDGRKLPFEVWSPAEAQYAGRDLSAETRDAFSVLPDGPVLHQAAVRDAAVSAGSYPLVLFSHASGGHRRQSSFLCTHLASHGYVVAAVDHMGNTGPEMADVIARIAAGHVATPEEMQSRVRPLIAQRVPDVRFLLDQVLAGVAGDVSRQIDHQRIGLIGWSFGGWTVLATPEVDDRVGAVLALAPAGNSKPLPGVIPVTLTFQWQREVPTLLLAAEDDRFTPPVGIQELYERTPSSKRMFILRKAGHMHFGDHIEEEGGCSQESAHLFTRGLALAHLDAVLKGSDAADQFLASDAVSELQARGVAAVAYTGE